VTAEAGRETGTTHWLIDKSALARPGSSAQAGEWVLRIERGLVRITTDCGQHPAPSVPDLLIAATAELSGLTVLHLDKDFEDRRDHRPAGATVGRAGHLSGDDAADQRMPNTWTNIGVSIRVCGAMAW